MELGWISENCIQSLKEKLSTVPVLIHYSADKETKVSADASAYGLDGVLLQKQRNDRRPVFYTCRSLTETEQRYAQIEKEALAVSHLVLWKIYAHPNWTTQIHCWNRPQTIIVTVKN